MKYELINESLHEATPTVLKVLRVFWAAVQNILMGGVVYGYAALGPLLHENDRKGGAGLSTKYCQVMFFVAVSVSCITPLLAGAVLDAVGPRWTSVFFSMIFSFGCHIFAHSERISFGLFIPGMMLMAFAGPGINVAANYTVAYFPECGVLVSSILSISFHLSFLVFFLIDEIWKADRKLYAAGMDPSDDDGYKYIFENYSFICAGSVIISLVIHSSVETTYMRIKEGTGDEADETAEQEEKRIAEKESENEEERKRERNAQSILSRTLAENKAAGETAGPPAIAPLTQQDQRIIDLDELHIKIVAGSDAITPFDQYRGLTLNEKLCSAAFIRLAIFFSMSTFWVNFYIGTMEAALGDSMIVPYNVHPLYALQFTVVMAFGFLFIPVFNWMRDTLGRFTFSVVLVTIALISVFWDICLMWNTEESLVPTFICYALMRSAIFCFIYPYTQDVFGPEYRDVLVGVLFLISGAMGLIQVPLALFADGTCANRASDVMFSDCNEGHWEYVNLAKCFCTIYYFYFAYINWTERRHYYMAMSIKNEDEEGDTDKGRPESSLDKDAKRMSSYGATEAEIELR